MIMFTLPESICAKAVSSIYPGWVSPFIFHISLMSRWQQVTRTDLDSNTGTAVIIIIIESCWGTTDSFTTSFLHFSLFSTALWDMANSRPVHSLILSSHLFLCLPCLLAPFTVPCKMVLPDLMSGRHDHTTALCVSLQWSGGLRVARLPAGSWHGLPRW